jgi:hypothetical protein
MQQLPVNTCTIQNNFKEARTRQQHDMMLAISPWPELLEGQGNEKLSIPLLYTGSGRN